MSDRKFTDSPFSDTTETVECRSTQKPFFPSFSCHPPIDEPRYQHRRPVALPPIPGSVSSSVASASLPIKYPRKKEELILTDRDTASENSPEIEIVERDIIDSTLQVGSQCEWTGTGSEPQWDNPRSTKAYDHIDRHHGPKLKPLHFRGRAASNNQEQGQWLDRKDWVEAERVTPKFTGRYIINFNRPIGRVYHPDGTVTENVTHAFIRRKRDGTLKSAYPILDRSTLSSSSRTQRNDHE